MISLPWRKLYALIIRPINVIEMILYRRFLPLISSDIYTNQKQNVIRVSAPVE